MKLPLTKFSQKDPKWSSEKLGTSSVTIGDYGCALAVLASVEKYYNFDTDPSRLNKLLVEKSVYMNRNLMGWWNINKVNEFVTLKEWIDCPTTPAPMDKVDAELEAERPVIAWVDINPNEPGNQQHFIVIIGKAEDGAYFILDPWYLDEEAIYFHARYGEPSKGILGLRLINGPVPHPDAPMPSVADLEGQIAQYKSHIDDIKEHLRPLVMPGDDFPKIIGAIDELKEKARLYDEKVEEEEEELNKEPEPEEEIAWEFKILNLTIRFLIPKGVKKV